MADNSADTDWIDCNRLRREAEAGGNGRADGISASLSKFDAGEASNDNAWRSCLRLIEPDGTETEVTTDPLIAAEVAAQEKARVKAEAKREADAKAKAEAEAKSAEAARKKAQAKAKREAEAKARAEAEERERAEEEARQLAEAKAAAEARKKAAEEKARKEAEAKKKAEAEEKARKAAETKAKKEAEEKARAEAKAKREAEEKAKREAAAKAKREAEAQAKKEAEEKARAEAEAKAREKAKEKAKKKAKKKEREAAEARARAENLGVTFRRLIRETGPISLAQYMGESNARYYASRDPLGGEGDFITAPEISQIFGELIGLWFADVWVKMGSRKRIHFVELGPGRGTLSSDALRTARRYGFEPQVHFVETSPALREIQNQAHPDVIHHHDIGTLPEDAPLLIVANEFFDALPVHQLVRSAHGWHERMVGLDDDRLVFVAGDKPMDAVVPKSWKSASQGSMIETSSAAAALMADIAKRLKEQGGAALIIDYGPTELRAGSTLQALKAHRKVDPLSHPGEADLTAHVDFEMLQDVTKANGADVMGLQMQGEWLAQMGIDLRHEALLRKSPDKADQLKRQYNRLTADDQMGTLFKVLGVCGPRWPIGAGFD